MLEEKGICVECAADVLTAIRETKDLSKETEALLNKAITTRVAEFLQNQ